MLAGAPLFGEESFEQGLRRQSASLGLEDRVHFLGFRDDVWSIHRDLDVVVHASTLVEPYGKVVLKTMASRRTLVAPPPLVACWNSSTTSAPGCWSPRGDVDALADVLAQLLRSPDERKRLADAGRRHVQESFSLERYAARVGALWREVMEECRSRTLRCG